MAIHALVTEARPMHQCSICGKLGHWSRRWSWYGSIADIEGKYRGYKMVRGPRPVVKVCSAECRAKHSARLNLDMG